MTSKSSLSLRLTEPVVFLRTTQGPNAISSQPAMVRGLLTLNLRRASRVKSIEVRLETRTSVIWPEGIGVRRMEIVEDHIIRSQRIVFFDASAPLSALEEQGRTVLPARRAISVGPGLHVEGEGDDGSEHSAEERRRGGRWGFGFGFGESADDERERREGREGHGEEVARGRELEGLPQRAMSTARGMSVGRGYASMVGAEHEPAQEHPYPSGPPPYARNSSLEREEEGREEAGLSPIASSGESRSASRTRGRTSSRGGASGSGGGSGSRRSGSRGEGSTAFFAARAGASLSPVRGILQRSGSSPAPTAASVGTVGSGSTLALGTSPGAFSGLSGSTTPGASGSLLSMPAAPAQLQPEQEPEQREEVRRPPLGSPRASDTSLPSQHSAPSIRNHQPPITASPIALVGEHLTLEGTPLDGDASAQNSESEDDYSPEAMHPHSQQHSSSSSHAHGARHASTSTVTPSQHPATGSSPSPGPPKQRVTFARRVSQGALQNLMRRNSRDDAARPGPFGSNSVGNGSALVDSPPGSASPHSSFNHHHLQQTANGSGSPVPSPHHSVHFPSPPPSAQHVPAPGIGVGGRTPLGSPLALGEGSPSPSLRHFSLPGHTQEVASGGVALGLGEDTRSRSRSRVRGVVEGVKNIFRSSSRPREPVHAATLPVMNGHSGEHSGGLAGGQNMSRQNSHDSPGPGPGGASRPPMSGAGRRGSTDLGHATERLFVRRMSGGEQAAEPFVEPGPRGGSHSRERRGSDAQAGQGVMHYYGRGGAGARGAPAGMGVHEEGSEERRGREMERGRERSREKTPGPADAWREFRKGTYTYPVVFPLPPPAPTTVHTEFGTVKYYLVGVVHRSGPFSPRLQSEKEVEVIDVPPDEEPETVNIERQWEESLRYVIGLDNKTNLVGGELAFDLTLMPLDKIRIYRLSVALEQKIDYFSRGQRLTRYDVPRKWDLLSVKSAGKNIPLLPLANLTPAAGPVQQLLALCPPGMDVSEFAGTLLQLTGPWQVHETFKLPTCKMGIHRGVKLTRGGHAVKVSHTLKIVIRVERTDSTGNKKWDIMVDTPINLFDCRCSPEYTSLPTYNALLQPVPASSASCACPARTTSSAPLAVPDSVLRLVQSHAPGPIASITHASGNDSPTGAGPSLVESLAERNRQFARLVEGREDIEGERPPSYEEVAGSSSAGPSTRASSGSFQ